VLTIAYARPADFLARVPFDCKLDPKLVRMDEVLDDPKVMLAVANDLARSAPEARWPCFRLGPERLNSSLSGPPTAKTGSK